MNLLLDTHALLSITNQELIPRSWNQMLKNKTRVLVSAISAWEIFMLEKSRYISLTLQANLWFEEAIEQIHAEVIELDPIISWEAVHLSWEHKDPADRWIVATARLFNATLLTRDKKIISSGLVQTFN